MRKEEVDRSAFEVVSFDEAEEQDRLFWHSKSPDERLEAMEYLRRLNYGPKASEGLQRVLEITQREER